MENIDVMVLRSLSAWRQAGMGAMLVTVVRTWGSSPRPIGSIMALADDGSLVGSVSGGCLEDDLIDRYRPGGTASATLHPATRTPPELVRYGIDADEAHRFGLPCGGTIELLLEFNPAPAILNQWLEAISNGGLATRTVRLSDGAARVVEATQSHPLLLTTTHLVHTLGPAYRMLLIGAGQLSGYVATMAQFSGFEVTVCDPRTEYAWSIPGVTLVRDMPDDVVTAFRPDRRSCVVGLTHDPKLDDLALLEALGTDAFYVGAIGSRRNNAARRTRMQEHFGATDEQLRRLKGPIGIYVGSKTPAEIAVSVMAEILAAKNGVHLAPHALVLAGKEAHEARAANDPAGAQGDEYLL